jgi:hypothetical protein
VKINENIIGLPIVKEHLSLFYKIFLALYVISILVFSLSFLIIYSLSFKISLFCFVGLTILTPFVSIITKNYRKIGDISVLIDNIVVRMSHKEDYFEKKTIENLTIKYFSYSGASPNSISKSIKIYDGTGNLIQFYYKSKFYSFEFLLQKKSDIIFIYKKLKQFEYEFILLDCRHGKKQKNLL